jgi:hypothetical protein
VNKSNHRALGATVAGFACIGVGAVLSVLVHSSRHWGADLTAAVFWSLPLGLVVAAVYAGWLRFIQIHRLLAPLGLLVIGPAVGIGWAFVVRSVLGGYYYAFGTNVLLLWCASATAGLIAGWWVHKIASLSDG